MSADFVASKLGSLDHWQAVYDRELDTFDEIGDEGEVWSVHFVKPVVTD